MQNFNKKPSISVAIQHLIHLTKSDRYNLHDRNIVQCVGYNLPTWNDKGRTSEPSREVFCNYTIHNDASKSSFIRQNTDGYEINLPQLPPSYIPPPPVPLELWRIWKQEDREKYARKFKIPLSSVCLLDITDSGSQVMGFGHIDRANVKGTPVNAIHYIRIATRESLIESLC